MELTVREIQYLKKWELWRFHEKNIDIFARHKDGSHYYLLVVMLAEIDKIYIDAQDYKDKIGGSSISEIKDQLITNV